MTSKELQELQWEIKRLLARTCTREYIRQCDEECIPPWEAFKSLADAGWLGVWLPEKYGGGGMGLPGLCALLEAVAEKFYALALMINRGLAYGGATILKFGTEEQKEEFLPRIGRGELMFSFGLTEPDSGSDAASLRTRAVPDGNHYRVTGEKMFMSGAHIADYGMVITRTNPSVPKHKGLTAFILDMKTPGITVRPVPTLGIRPVATTQTTFDDVPVPASRILGGLNQGWNIVVGMLDYERITYCSMVVGAMQSVLDQTVTYSKQRVQFEKPIADFQVIQHKLANMDVDLYVSRTLSDKLMAEIEKGTDVRRVSATTKLFCTEAYRRVADEGLQIHGGYGYTMEFDLQRHFRDARLSTIGGGSSEILRNLIARDLVK